MSSKEYIIDNMHKLVEAFPSTRVRYDYHLLSNTHTLELVPSEIYHFDNDYKSWEENLLFDFIDKFPNESLSVVTEDSSFGIDKCDLELFGKQFLAEDPTVTFDDSLGTALAGALLPQVSDELFKYFNPQLSINPSCKIVVQPQIFITSNLSYFELEEPQSRYNFSYHEFHAQRIDQFTGFKEAGDELASAA